MRLLLGRTLLAALLVIASLVSMFVVSGIASSPELHSATINSLNEKQNTVLAITATATTSATQVSEIPGSGDEKTDKDKNWLEKTVDKVSSVSKSAIEGAKNILSGFVNSVAMLMVTSILIPILVVLSLLGVIKILFGVQLHMPDRKQMKLKDKEVEFEFIEE